MRSSAPNFAAQWIVACISSYQKHISPRKGWNCAYRVRNGGESCSQWIKIAVMQHGCITAIPLIRTRFAACKEAANSLRRESHENTSSNLDQEIEAQEKRKPRKRKSDCCDGWSDMGGCCDVFPSFLHLLSGCRRGTGTIGRIADASCDCGPGDTGCVDCNFCSCP
jgi:putative component of membrane protein insertase Oxa1/YidC/SpoIIIJ protein YidD